MGNKYASKKNSIAICDRCGMQYKLKQLRALVIKTKVTNILVCPECWDPDQPQLQVGMYPVSDPMAVRDPRPDNTYRVSGINADGFPSDGSRIIQWGWKPVGGARAYDNSLTPNPLVSVSMVNSVTVTT